MKIGNATMRPVIEIERFAFPASMIIARFSPADASPHADWLSPRFYDIETNSCQMSQHAWLIEAEGKRILVDPCVGNMRDRPAMPVYHQLASPMLDNLKALGVEPESIDYVFCTHLHLDHVGWNTRLEDGRWVPTFPNARYLFSRIEDAYWRADAELGAASPHAYNARVYDECIRPVIDAGLADLCSADTRVAGCLTLIDAPGHTVGHMAGLLESGGEGAVLAGDAIHNPIQVLYPDREINAGDQEQARLTRHMLLELCADRDYWLAPAHFQPPHVCKVRRDGAGYRMEWPE